MDEKNNLWDPEQIAGYGSGIYEAAVRLLAKHGMLIEDELWRDRILSHSGTSEKDQRIYFPEELIRNTVPFGKPSGFKLDWMENSFHFRRNDPDANGFRLRVGGFAMAVFDPELGGIRPSTTKDLEEAISLCNVLGIGGHYPCTATDIHPSLRNIMAHKMCLTKSDIHSTHVCSGIEQAEIIHAMHTAAGPECQMPLTLTIVTPFRIEETNLKVIRNFIEKDIDKKSVRIVPVGYGLSGMNYPITLGGAWTMCLAEHIGLYLSASLLESGFDIAPSVGPVGVAPVDLKAMCISGGNPSQAFYTFANTILAHAVLGEDWRQFPEAEVPLWASSPLPDEQAAIEKLTNALMAIQRNAGMFGRLGNLCVDDVFSCEQLLLDMEIINHCRDSVNTFGKVEEFMSTEDLESEVEDFITNDVSFMMADSTLKNLRILCPESDKTFFRGKLASLTDKNHSRLLNECATRKKELLSKYNFSLGESIEKEIDKIYNQAEAKFS